MFRALLAATVLSLLNMVPQQQKGGEGEETGPYDVVERWPQPFARPGYVQGSQGGVFAETPNRIILGNRGELKLPSPLPSDFNGSWGSLGQRATLAPPAELRNCIVIVDANGTFVESWTQHDHLFQGGRGPHKVRISPYDPDRHVWVVDDQRHQVLEFTHDGKTLVRTLGEPGVAGNDASHFARPTDIAWLPDGTFFITDGYVNTRVVKFDKTGKFLMTWGTPGAAHGQFNLPHAIDIDRNRRVYVADRANHRIQIFDEHGKFLDEWPNIRTPTDIMVAADNSIWVSDLETSKFLKYDANGRLLYHWGVYGTYPGGVWGIHQFSVDSAGNVYVAETYGGRTQKFVPKANADKAKLMSAPIASKRSS
jgi:NHL repeat-containing protein